MLLPVYILKSACLLTMLAGLFMASISHAALPSHVGGQALPTLAPMLEKVTPAVVNISAIGEVTVRRRQMLFNDPFFRHFFNIPPHQTETRKTQSLGSGVVVDASNGYVLTNHHVIEGGKKIIVTFKDGRQLEARLIGSDPRTDVALLQIPSKGLSAIPMANSDNLHVGDFAVAIGNPFGLGQTVTSGIISALGRSGLGLSNSNSEQNFEEFIQTDAAINVGNSGGALVNLSGELIGINTAILSPNRGGNVGIGFAIPMNMARAVMQQLIMHGQIKRGYFGVVVQTLTPELAQAINTNIKQGVIIASIEKDSPANRSGLKVHDVVTRVNGQRVTNATEMRNRIGLLNIDDKVELEVYRGHQKLALRTRITGDKHVGSVSGEKLDYRLAGALLSNIPESSPLHGRGIYVTDIKRGSPAVSAGLEKGDIIASINHQTIKGLHQAERILRQKPAQLLMNIQRGRNAFFLLVH